MIKRIHAYFRLVCAEWKKNKCTPNTNKIFKILIKASSQKLVLHGIYIYISGWIFQKVLAEIVQKDLILSQKALISNRRNLGFIAPTLLRFPSKDSKWKDLSF